MNRYLVVFAVICFLLAGSILIYGANSRKPDTGTVTTIVTTPTPKVISSCEDMDKVTELKIEDIIEGTGKDSEFYKIVKSGDTAEVNYLGTFMDGTKFDSSYDRHQTFEFKVGNGDVIKGWDQGLIGMKVGGKRKLTIPPDLAYGAQGAPGAIPPNCSLIFEIELVNIKN